jgi:hypothetical protein
MDEIYLSNSLRACYVAGVIRSFYPPRLGAGFCGDRGDGYRAWLLPLSPTAALPGMNFGS